MMPSLEEVRVGLGEMQHELDRRRMMIRIFAVVSVLLLAVSVVLAVQLRAVDEGVRRADCARAIADEANRLDRDADRAFAEIVVSAFRLPQGSAVTPELEALVDRYDAANRRRNDRPPNQVLVERTCPG